MDTDQYMGIFLDESREHLQALNDNILALESDPQNQAVLDDIFRSAHTLKGMSATMGFNIIAELTHEMENILDLLRKNKLQATESTVDLLFRCVDALEKLIDDVASGGEGQQDITSLVASLRQMSQEGQLQPSPKATLGPAGKEAGPVSADLEVILNDTEQVLANQAVSQGLNVLAVYVRLHADCLMKSARAYMVMKALDELGDVIKVIPPVDDLEKENFVDHFTAVVLTTQEKDDVQARIMEISEIAQVEVSQVPVTPSTAPQNHGNGREGSDNQKLASGGNNGNGHEHKLKISQSVRVDIEKLDALLNLVGELVINKTRLEQIGLSQAMPDLAETVEQIDRITTDLQAVVMKVRMVPVSQVFNRFPRMVRDLSHELGKEINLIIEGEDTELDRTVIDEIGDPLVHLLRNAVDHGVESPDERRRAGKNPVGEVRLIARQEGNNVIILVEDDGKGIDPAVIRQKAVEKNIFTKAEADKMDDNEIIKVIFLPGFSTANTVSDISGRGVGMDAVKTKIESLGGMVEIYSQVGVGTRFQIRLPLTLAIIQALLVRVASEIYAIPLGTIDSTIKITAGDITTVQNQEVVLLRGKVIPLVRLSKVLQIPTAGQSADEAFVVIVFIGDRQVGIIVDDLIGQQEIVIKSLGKLLAGIKGIAGATILGNGRVALILDVAALI